MKRFVCYDVQRMLVETERHGPDGGVALLTLRRGARANAYNDALLRDLQDALRAVLADEAIRALVITGEGARHFCAGADLDEMAGRAWSDALHHRSQRVFAEVAAAPIPTLAAINGWAAGGGLELALACDVRIASSAARFSFPETSLGLIPAAGGTFRLPRAIGVSRAKEMILLGRELSAEEALQIGLVTEVVAPDALRDRALARAAQAAARHPLALRLAKQAIDRAFASEEGALALERASQAMLLRARDDAAPDGSWRRRRA